MTPTCPDDAGASARSGIRAAGAARSESDKCFSCQVQIEQFGCSPPIPVDDNQILFQQPQRIASARRCIDNCRSAGPETVLPGVMV